MALKPQAKPAPLFVAPKRYCSTVGCEQVAALGLAVCAGCDERVRNERAEAANRARGLITTEQKRAFCRQLLKRGFGRPSFERWAEAMTQATVDLIDLQDSDADRKLLERLRAFCVIDEQKRLIPVEQRPALREARAARIEAERARVEALLKAHGVVRRDVEHT